MICHPRMIRSLTAIYRTFSRRDNMRTVYQRIERKREFRWQEDSPVDGSESVED